MPLSPDEHPIDVLDLSLPLDAATPVYADPRGYADPPTRIETLVEIGERRGGFVSPFRVSRLTMGTHTGTHVDAPAHFHAGRPTVSDLPLALLVGRAAICDLTGCASDALAVERLAAARPGLNTPGATPLLLTDEGSLGPDACAEVARLGPSLVVVAGPLDTDPDCPRTAALLAAGLWLVTDVSVEAARQVREGDLLVVAPLPVRDVEGAPCRVLAIRSAHLSHGEGEPVVRSATR